MLALTFGLLLAAPQIPAQVQVVCQTPIIPMHAHDHAYLVYELQVTNDSFEELELQKVVALGPHDRVLGSVQQAGMRASLSSVADTDRPERLSPGQMVVVRMWLQLERDGVPDRFRHHVVLQRQDGDFLRLQTPSLTLARRRTTNLGAPLSGTNWIAGNGPSNESPHRRTRICVDGHPYYAQRFAIDYVQTGADGLTYTGSPSENQNYHCYGKHVLAVANAKVVSVVDGLAENVPRSGKLAIEVGLRTLGGNSIILDLGNGLYAGYAHLIPGSIRVEVGQRVRAGQVLARVGNSGNSSEPHLHFQVMDGPNLLAAEGLPYGYRRITVQPMAPMAGNPEALMKVGAPTVFRNQMPLADDRVTF